MMNEIGGYIELDSYHLPMLHEGAIALNCGRNALAYLLKARSIKCMKLPQLLCASVPEVCRREGVTVTFYPVGMDFLPEKNLTLDEEEWLYLVNYYGQIPNEVICGYVRQYQRVIVDQAQDYYARSIVGVDTLYTCRKWFGVPDGAFLYTDARLQEPLPQDESFERMRFLLGRYERTASEFYHDYTQNNLRFATEPIKRMSKLTQNLLHGIEYPTVERTRRDNYSLLHTALKKHNLLRLAPEPGCFMYPFMISNGNALRRVLQAKKIYIPTLWPSVFSWAEPGSTAYQMAGNILPLPIDQRYGAAQMQYLAQELLGMV